MLTTENCLIMSQLHIMSKSSRCILLLHTLMLWGCNTAHTQTVEIKMPAELPVSTANLTVSYQDPNYGGMITEIQKGRYAIASPITFQYGRLIHVLTEDGGNHGCLPIMNAPDEAQDDWIALVERGQCKFHQKVINAAFFNNASAVVVYDHVDVDDLLVMHHFVDEVVSVFISKRDGEHLATLLDSGVHVHMNISLHRIDIIMTASQEAGGQKGYKVQPLFIISVTMITCLIVALTVLLVCGIRRAKSKHKSNRPVVFTVNDRAAHQRLLMTDLPDCMALNNNNNVHHNHTIINLPRLQPHAH